MLREKRFFRSFLIVSAISASAFGAALAHIGGSEVQFQALGPAGLKINGSGSTLAARENDGKLSITVPLSDLKTGIGLRDDHLKKALETNKYPNAVLVVERSALKFPADNKTESAEAQGQMTLHGVTKPVKFQYQVKRTGSDYDIQGKTEVNIQDFKIEKPCYLGVCVDPNVKIKSRFKLRDS